MGMQIEHVDKNLYIHQENYINQIIDNFCMSDANPANTPADVNCILTKNSQEIVVNFLYRQTSSKLLTVFEFCLKAENFICCQCIKQICKQSSFTACKCS